MNNRTTRFIMTWMGIFMFLVTHAQDRYRYSVDLNNVTNDQISVELFPPAMKLKEAIFFMPKIIPGTYSNADYGKFVHNFVAVDRRGKHLPVSQTSTNSWKIKNASKLYKITYDIEDTWESNLEHDVYDMAGTNFEAERNFVINTPGIFGYFDGMKRIPFELTFKKPQTFYASTPLRSTASDAHTDVFVLQNVDHLYDSPIMFSKPDTTTIRLGKTQVLISSYSPRKMVTSQAIADLLKDLLLATESYLGGKLPVDKYAFIFYFNGEQPPLKRTGALEHNYSSFYALPELPFQQLAPLLLDISAHEFFHIVTPLTISSKEVKEFDYNKPVLSKHLWLYEGTTEYHSDHVQVVEGLASQEEFLAKLAEKIKISKSSYVDSLPFTVLSAESAGKHADQYPNVYEKGALISACLDIYLYHLSKGKYGIRNLKHDLSIKFGKDRYFEDDRLFDIITELSYPEVREFFTRHVEGSEPIPYDRFFGYAGVDLALTRTPSIGNIQIAPSPEGKLVVADISQMNSLGKTLGYQTGDVLISLNGETLDVNNAQALLDKYKNTARKDDALEIVVLRKENEISTEKTLRGKVVTTESYALQLNPSPTAQQRLVRKAWMGGKEDLAEASTPVAANPNDVSTINQLVNALYDVISGPAGPRDWKRFQSLFYPGAEMGAVVPAPGGEKKLKKFTPEQYIKSNAPLFEKFGFHETEVGRIENVYGDIAQVFTAYAFTLDTPTPVKERGINNLQLIFEEGRWWIMSITWVEETKDNPIPAKYLRFSK